MAQDDAGLLQAHQALRQHVGADAGEVCPDLAEAAGAEDQLAHDEQRPTLADELQGERGTASVVVPTLARRRGASSYFF